MTGATLLLPVNQGSPCVNGSVSGRKQKAGVRTRHVAAMVGLMSLPACCLGFVVFAPHSQPARGGVIQVASLAEPFTLHRFPFNASQTLVAVDRGNSARFTSPCIHTISPVELFT